MDLRADRGAVEAAAKAGFSEATGGVFGGFKQELKALYAISMSISRQKWLKNRMDNTLNSSSALLVHSQTIFKPKVFDITRLAF
jgi:hypothetical protein